MAIIGNGLAIKGSQMVAGNLSSTAPATIPWIQSGLILLLAASDKSSYPGTGNTWYDISGQNNTATFVSSSIYTPSSASFYLTANNYATTVQTSISFNTATFIAWINPSQIQNNYTGILYLPTSSINLNFRYGMQLRTGNSVGYTWGSNGATTYNWDSTLYTPSNQWSMIAMTVNTNIATAYLCKASGITTATNSDTHTSASGYKYYIGRDSIDYNQAEADLRTFKGYFGLASVYNRVLSSEEITTNFNNTRAIYGV